MSINVIHIVLKNFPREYEYTMMVRQLCLVTIRLINFMKTPMISNFTHNGIKSLMKDWNL